MMDEFTSVIENIPGVLQESDDSEWEVDLEGSSNEQDFDDSSTGYQDRENDSVRTSIR